MSSKHLPSEIIEAILLFLPAKSLCRFKSVSKTLYSLISHPRFIKTHTRNLHQSTIVHPKLLAVSTTRKNLCSIDIATERSNDDDDHDNIMATNDYGIPGKELISFHCKEILASCNGLVLAKDENDTIVIINPMTQKEAIWKVPVCPYTPPFLDEDDDVEIYEDVYVKYGLGYDSSMDDYKILSISFWDYNGIHNCRDSFETVYSLRNNSWKQLPYSRDRYHDHTVLGDNHLGVINGPIINQSLHWNARYFTIGCFNFESEEFNEIELPELPNFPKFIGSYTGDVYDIGGKLSVFLDDINRDLLCCVMEEYGVDKSWTGVLLNGVGCDEPPLCIIDREIVFEVGKNGLGVYNIDEKRRRDIKIAGGPVSVFGGTFVESLESPKRITTPSKY